MNRNKNNYSKRNKHLLNEEIRFKEVRVLTDDGSEIISIQNALNIAENEDKDLILIVPNAKPPVCKIQEYSKYLYDEKKKQKNNKSQKIVLKEIKYTPHTDDHDYDFKLKSAIKFLEKGHKLKATVYFKGRTITFKEQGKILLLKLSQDLSEYGKLERMPELQGKKMSIMINPK